MSILNYFELKHSYMETGNREDCEFYTEQKKNFVKYKKNILNKKKTTIWWLCGRGELVSSEYKTENSKTGIQL